MVERNRRASIPFSGSVATSGVRSSSILARWIKWSTQVQSGEEGRDGTALMDHLRRSGGVDREYADGRQRPAGLPDEHYRRRAGRVSWRAARRSVDRSQRHLRLELAELWRRGDRRG